MSKIFRVRKILCRCIQMMMVVVMVNGWDVDGHEAVGMVAMSALDGRASNQLKRLLQGKDAVEDAGWAHKAESAIPWSKPLHFIQQPEPFSNTLVINDITCPDGQCLLEAIKIFYDQAKGDTSKSSQKDRLMRSATRLPVQVTDADAVRFLINLIGDMHQPLHEGSLTDDFGRKTLVALPNGSVMSLYELWDHDIIQSTIQNHPQFWWSGWTHIQRVDTNTYNADKKAWQEDNTAALTKWCQENAEFANQFIYTNPLTNERFPLGGDAPIEVDAALLDKWRQLLIQRILLAGSRTAIILNDILESSAAPGLRSGSIVTPPVADEIEIDDLEFGNGQPPRRRQRLDTTSDILLQLGVLAVVVVIGLAAYLVFMMVSKSKGKAGEAGGLRLPTVVQSKKEMLD
ncbi:hypothetical protein FOZ60_011360 [Perkinsus olseni]|uniref:Uncharacterized protein n=2 Tax=Perkinsus olseni TaxID=32597 RepID=A0A7J6NDN4_PEROL|nr:hypothetical protein FOZ60_011360 [Perkinsus olseni]